MIDEFLVKGEGICIGFGLDLHTKGILDDNEK